MARRAKQHYIDAGEFRAALLEAQSLGEPTVRVCNLFRLLISRYLSGPRYSGYDAATLEDLASAAFEKCLKNIANFRPDRGSPFSYFTLAVECSAKDNLGKHYRHRNMIREVGALERDEWLGSVPNYVRSGKIPPPTPLTRETETKPRRRR